MPILLGALYIDTVRPTLNLGTNSTGVPIPYLFRIQAYGQPMYARKYYDLPSTAVQATYEFLVDVNTDIAVGDIITNVTQSDNVTSWPGDADPSTYTFHVVYVRPTAARFLPAKVVMVTRVTTQGPSHVF